MSPCRGRVQEELRHVQAQQHLRFLLFANGLQASGKTHFSSGQDAQILFKEKKTATLKGHYAY